jgi:hypothetical protein
MNTILVRARTMTNALLVTAVVDFGLGGRCSDAPAADTPELLRLGRRLLHGSSPGERPDSPQGLPTSGA